ncbi:hypothetical protein CsSME_00007794 [Camellia sinensis var. sinensis]
MTKLSINRYISFCSICVFVPQTFSLLSTSFLSSSSSLPVPAWLLIVTLPPHWLLFHLWPSPHAERVGIEGLLLLNPHL